MKNSFLIAVVLFFLSLGLMAQKSVELNQRRIKGALSYLGVEPKASADKLKELSNSLLLAEDTTLSVRERAKYWEAIQNFFFDIVEDPDTTFQKRWLQFGGYPLFSAYFGRKMLEYSWTKNNSTPPNQLAKVQKFGTGKESLIMIPPEGFDTSIYEEFIRLHSSEYTIYAVTLPGFGGTPPYYRGDKRDLAKMTWFGYIEQALLELLRKENIKNTYILGNSLGGFIALRFGLNHPEKTNGIIVINGRIHTPMSSLIHSGQQASPKERSQRVAKFFPKAEFSPYPIFQPYANYQSPLSKQSDRIRSIQVQNMKKTDVYAYRIYEDQFMAEDLFSKSEHLKVPVLALNSVHDALSPFVVFSRNKLISWQKLKQAHPNSPIHLLPLQNSRNLVLYDQPREVGKIITSFTRNPEAFATNQQNEATHVVNVSPKASISQTFSNTDVSMTYSRPEVKGRKLLGALIPLDKVWRAGANEATQISFSRDVIIQDSQIKKGTYTLFVEPSESKWTIILNSMPDQWGAFNYDPELDVARFETHLESADHMERLKYDFENLSATKVELTLHWGTHKVRLPIEESFKVPYVPTGIKSYAWQLLLEDVEGDGRNPGSSDGKAFYYYYNSQTDSIWFKFETYNDISLINPAISVSLDTDMDQKNGAIWYGSNESFKLDLMLSTGPVRQGSGYSGWNGITDAKGVSSSTWMNVMNNNLTFYFDPDMRAYYMGLKRSDLGKNVKKLNLIGSVGANSLWNDDIGENGTYATIDLRN